MLWPNEVALASVEYAPMPGVKMMPGSVGTHTFNFIAMEEIKDKKQTVQIKFALICLHNPGLQIHSPAPVEEVAVDVEIVPCNAEALSGFVKYSENTATYNAAIPYGFPNAVAGELYGFPDCCATAVDAGANCKYGFPLVKYGYPGC